MIIQSGLTKGTAELWKKIIKNREKRSYQFVFELSLGFSFGYSDTTLTSIASVGILGFSASFCSTLHGDL